MHGIIRSNLNENSELEVWKAGTIDFDGANLQRGVALLRPTQEEDILNGCN